MNERAGGKLFRETAGNVRTSSFCQGLQHLSINGFDVSVLKQLQRINDTRQKFTSCSARVLITVPGVLHTYADRQVNEHFVR